MPALVVLILLVLGATSAKAQPVLINEVHTGSPDHLELVNLTNAVISIGGFTVATWYRTSPSGVLTTEPAYTIPAGRVLAPGATIVLQEQGVPGAMGSLGSCSLATGLNYNWANTSAVEVVLRDAFGVGVDYVYRNPFGGASSPNLPIGQSWFGTLSSTTGDTIARSQNLDSHSASDWSVTSTPASPCGLNPGQVYGHRLLITTMGFGDATFQLISEPALPNAECFTLYSVQNFEPNGSGPFLGLGLDVLPQLLWPEISNSPFHSRLSAAGQLALSYPPATLPSGLFFEATSVFIVGGLLIGPTPVLQLSF